MQEFNDINEFTQTQEQQGNNEAILFASNPTFEERGDVEKSTSAKTTQPKFDYKKLLSAIMTVVMAGVGLGVGVILPVADGTSPLNDVMVVMQEFGAHPDGTIFFNCELTSPTDLLQIPLQAVVYNDFTERSMPLEIMQDAEFYYAGGIFEGLKVGVTYTFAIVGKSTLGNKEIFAQKVTVPHPIEDAYAQILELNAEVSTIYYYVEVVSPVALEILLTLDGKEVARTPFDNTSGGLTDGNPDDVNSGEMSGSFDNLQFGVYTLSVVGKGLYGKQVTVAWQEITVGNNQQ